MRHTASGAVVNSAPSIPGWASIPPSLQFALSSLRPGLIATPYVEVNNTPSRYPTAVLHGENEAPFTAATAAEYVFIINDPWSGYDVLQGTPGIAYGSRPDNVLALPFTMNWGAPFADFYGAMAITSRYRIYGQTLDISVVAPEATISGTAYLGSLPRGSMVGCNVGYLRDSASEVVDLKTNPTFSLKAWINDKSLIHGNLTINDVSDEFVSFAVLQRSSVQAVTADGARGFTLAIKAHANLLWEPTINTPFVASLTMRPPDNTRPLTLSEQAFVNATVASIPVPEPEDLQTIMRQAQFLTKGGTPQPIRRPRHNPPATRAMPRALLDPALSLWNPTDSLAYAITLQDLIRPRVLPDKYWQPLSDVVQDIVTDLRKASEEYVEHLERFRRSKTRVVSKRDHDELEYLDIPRQPSVEKSDRFSLLSSK